jgi:ketosteroid isomerase-like protein
MPETPEAVALSFIAAINAADASALHALMTDDHTFTDALGNSVSGAEKMFSGWQHFLYAYPDYRITVAQSFVKDDEVALFGVAEGRWRVEGQVLAKSWKVNAAWLAKIAGGKVRRWSVFCDTGWAKPPA